MPRMCKSGNTLCWDCKNESCDWIMAGKPVEGWRARKTKIHNPEKDTESFEVRSCPLYKGSPEQSKEQRE